MTVPDIVEFSYFKKQFIQAHQNANNLRHSFERATPLIKWIEADKNVEISLEKTEILEALAVRFARLTDTLTDRVFCALDAIESLDEGSMIDRFNRMEKRGIITNVEEWLEIRELRTRIAHDYIVTDLIQMHYHIFQKSEMLFNAVDAIARYIHEKGWE